MPPNTTLGLSYLASSIMLFGVLGVIACICGEKEPNTIPKLALAVASIVIGGCGILWCIAAAL